MNKKLLTWAVAAAMAAPVAAMADATLYGKINMSIDYFDIDAITNPNTGAVIEDGFDGWTLSRGAVGEGASRASRLGVKGSEDLGNGLKAIYQIEFGIPMEDTDGRSDNGDRGRISMRNSFVGLASDWGTLLVGRHDTPFKISTGKLDLFTDTMADYNGTVGFNDVRADNTILYISPNFSGFQLAAATMPGGNTAEGVGIENSDSLAEGYSLAGIYNNGPFFAAVAYESFSDDLLVFQDDDDINANGDTNEILSPGDDFNKWRIGLGILDWNGFTLAGIYEDQSNVGGFRDADQELWQIQAGYAFGNNQFKAMYGQADRTFDGNVAGIFDGDAETWAVGFDHNFSKRTTAYILYTEVDEDDPTEEFRNWSGFSLGMIHSF